MPRFLVKMNIVEAKTTTFVIDADNENDVYDGLGELSSHFFENKCDWITSDYEQPTIESVKQVIDTPMYGHTLVQNNISIQKRFDNIIKEMNNERS